MHAIGREMNVTRRSQQRTFRSRFVVEPKRPRTLTYDEFREVQFHALPTNGGRIVVDKNGSGVNELKALLPAHLHAHYDKVRLDQRFEQLVLFAKNHVGGASTDGMLTGYSHNEYTVLVVWDPYGHDIWEPYLGDIGTQLA